MIDTRSLNRRDFLIAGATTLVAAACGPRLGGDLPFDIILVGGTVYDGTGSEGLSVDVGVKNGRIIALGNLRDKRAGYKLDVGGLAVAPGFIDFHSHSDEELLLRGEAQSKIRQGVTTEVIGQDGGSFAPLNSKMAEQVFEGLKKGYGVEETWMDFAGYFRILQKQGILSNVVSMVGQGTLREFVIGYENRPATAEEIGQMVTLAKEAFAQGAYGISSGLEYTPGSFASTEEIIALCQSMGGRGIYSTHMRNEDDTVVEAIEEAIAIARGAGVDLNISHLKSSGKRNWHKLDAVLARLDKERATGQVTCDRYPYIAYNTGLANLFPLWSREGGGEQFVQRLQDESLRDSINSAILDKIEKIGGWNSVMVSSLPSHPDRTLYEGKTMAELTHSGSDPLQLLREIVIAQKGGGSMVGFAMSEENTAKVLSYPYCMTASDGSALATEGMLRQGNPHPRAFGTFPRLLGKYVREDKIMPLAEAIRKISGLPAETLHLRDRGFIREGHWADLVVFDPKTVTDKATWNDPFQYPEGIPYVIVNGEVVIDDGDYTGELPGAVLKAPGDFHLA